MLNLKDKYYGIDSMLFLSSLQRVPNSFWKWFEIVLTDDVIVLLDSSKQFNIVNFGRKGSLVC